MTEPRRYAVIADGVVTNLVLMDPTVADTLGYVDLTDHPGVARGWTMSSGAFSPPADPTPSAEAITAARRVAYAAESDHLFIAWQAAVATGAADQAARKAAWLAARAAVQARLLYPG